MPRPIQTDAAVARLPATPPISKRAPLNPINIIDHGKGNRIDIDPTARLEAGHAIVLQGDGHVLKIGANTVVRALGIYISGSGNSLDIGTDCDLRGALHLRQNGSRLHIGAQTTFVGGYLFAMEGRLLAVGEDCMFSSGVVVRTSDEHPICDSATGVRLNAARDVRIGRHVWLGEGVTLAKGTTVPDGCVVGARSYVTKPLCRAHAVYTGSPARLVREGVCWSRELMDEAGAHLPTP